METNDTFKFEPAAVFQLSNGTFVARWIDCKPEGAKQVSRVTNSDFAIEIADELNKASDNGVK
tara:strand:- start:8154 stop:8342 length:189 start_codon:yes stop_codon:yes gene_type:complete